MNPFGDQGDQQGDQREYLQDLLSEGWVRQAEWVGEVDSTNSWAKRELQDSSSESVPRLWVADRQTEGRGRGTHRWWSPEGCLMFSLAWRPPDDASLRERLPQLALVIGIAIAKGIDRLGSLPCQVKWPNDLYLNERKVGGILVEAVGNACWVIGVGLNVRVPVDEANEEIRSRATSLHYWSHRPLDRTQVLDEVLEQIKQEIETWCSDERYLEREWESRCFLRDRLVEVDGPSGKGIGKCQGIDSFGRLRWTDSGGKTHTVLSGTVRAV